MVVAAKKYIGIGMYTPAEAAMYTRVSTQLISRWVHGNSKGSSAFRAQMADPDEKTITFLDLVQTLAIRAIREQSEVKVPLQAIREAVDSAERLGISYPFARRHTTYLLGQTIALKVEGHGVIEATGLQRRKQYLMKPIVEIFAKDLGYDAAGLAKSFKAYGYGDKEILLRPDYKFGEPIVGATGHTAWTLWEAVHTEGSIAAAAKAYRVTPADVEAAYRYIDSILPATAA